MELNTVKIHLNSAQSTINTKYMITDLNNFYLDTPMAQKEYAWLKIDFIPKSFTDNHNLLDMVGNGHVQIEISKGCMDYPRWEDWPTTYTRISFSPTDIMSPYILWACGTTSAIWCVSPYG